MSIRTLALGIVVSGCLIFGIGGGQGDAWGQAAQSEQSRHYRAKAITLFKELMQLKREGVLVFSVFEGVPGPSFGADNPRAYDWLQRVRQHLAQAPRSISCWDNLGLFICDHELLTFIGVNIDEFNARSVRFWLLTLCT